MDPHRSTEDAAFLKEWLKRARGARVPVSGSFELTSRCNFRCLHCYIPDGERDEGISTEEWCRIVDEVAAEGCIWLLFTGGEPLLRPDFAVIYEKAKRAGMIVSVFSNGTMVTAEHCELFRRLPPRYVEITLYGSCDQTYAAVTGVSDGHTRCLRGVTMLREAGVTVGLKTIVMKQNDHEIETIAALADQLGCSFRLDGDLFPRVDGDRSPYSLRVSPDRFAELEFSLTDRPSMWKREVERVRDLPHQDKLYECGAGISTFHVTSRGMLQPCVSSRAVQHDVLSTGFAQGWRESIPRIWQLKKNDDSPCTSCDQRFFCGICPALQEHEGGSSGCAEEFRCRLAEIRLDKISALEERYGDEDHD